MRTAWFIASKEVQYWLREREVWLWVGIMPVVFFFFIGTVTSGGGGGGGSRPDRLTLKPPEDGGILLAQIERRLEENNFEIVRAESDEQFQEASRRLVIPSNLTETVLNGEQVELRFERKSAGINNDYDRLRVGRAIYSTLADLVSASEAGGSLTAETLGQLNEMPRALSLKVESAGKRKKIPSGFEQTIPGTLVMFVLMNVVLSGAVTLLVDRKQGLLRRLASTPISRFEIYLGKWMARMMMGMIQIAVGLLTGTVLFRMQWGPQFPMVVLVLISWAGLCASLGLLVGCLGRSEGQVVGLSLLCSMVLAALGGCWWPIEVAPQWMQSIQLFLPTGWAMDAMHKLISFNLGAAAAIPHFLGMSACAALVAIAGARVFRFE